MQSGQSITQEPEKNKHCTPLLDLIRAPYVLYGVKHIDLVSLAPFAGPAWA